ncbi:MAG: GGDEF domain-containing protein [Terriglobia bacterium]
MSQGNEGIPEYWLDLVHDALQQLDVGARGAFLQKFFQSLVGREVSEEESVNYWEGIRARQNQWAAKLGQPVTLRTAVLVYFEELGVLQNPVLMEYEDLKKLRYDAATDALTGLNNRRMFDEYLDQEIGRSTRYGLPFALLLFDIHKFKTVNDTYGHATGDEMLRSVARASLETVRGSDIACRIGGDEFAILLPQADRPGSEVLAERISREFEGYARSIAPDTPVGIDYGISIFPADGHDATGLLAAADRGLYANKQKADDRLAGGTASAPLGATRPEAPVRQVIVDPAPSALHRPLSYTSATVAAEAGQTGSIPEGGFDGRKFERIRLDGTPALGIVRVAGRSCAIKVLDASRAGVGILIDQTELPETFQALLQVPILPGGELALQRIYSLPLPEGKRRVGCRLTSISGPK